MSACNIDQMDPPQSWIISIGCAGIVLGLWTLGKRVIKTVGKDIAKITPARYVNHCVNLCDRLCLLMPSHVQNTWIHVQFIPPYKIFSEDLLLT